MAQCACVHRQLRMSDQCVTGKVCVLSWMGAFVCVCLCLASRELKAIAPAEGNLLELRELLSAKGLTDNSSLADSYRRAQQGEPCTPAAVRVTKGVCRCVCR